MIDFQNVPVTCQPAYTWLWNTTVTKEGIRQRIQQMYDAGIRAFYVLGEPKNFRPTVRRTYLEPEYLSEEYLELVHYAYTVAKELGMYTWRYNEGGFPSGMACGRIRKDHPELAQKQIFSQEIHLPAGTAYTQPEDTLATFQGSTFLVFSNGLSPSAAAGAIVFFYLGMALGRFLSGLLSARLSPWRLIYLGAAIVCGAIVLLFAPVPAVVIAGLFLIGLGNGPIYPNLMYLVPENFGEDISASVIGSQMAFAYGGFMAAPPLLGILVQAVSAEVFPVYILFWFAVMVLFLWFFVKHLRRKT